MNDLLQLKGDFERRKNNSSDTFPMPSIKKQDVLTADKIDRLKISLESVRDYWSQHQELGGALVNVTYRRVIPKSSRIAKLFGAKSAMTICGSKFKSKRLDDGQVVYRHVFTHFLSFAELKKAVSDLAALSKIVESRFDSSVDYDKFYGVNRDNYSVDEAISRTRFLGLVADLTEVEDFAVATPDRQLTDESVVTLYDVKIETKELLKKYGISLTDDRIVNGLTVKLSPLEVQRLQSKAPYLIAMSVHNICELANKYDGAQESLEEEPRLIPPPTVEPVVGVIDTAFDTEGAYFKEWVDYHEMVPKGVKVRQEDRRHGTAISSIIVDGVRGNPDLEDHCGRFQVRHFGVLVGNRIDAFDFMQKVKEIVAGNLDIKVWNISVGSELEINPNFISPEGALLDDLQRQYDIVFVVAATNVPQNRTGQRMRIGPPADSLNSVVVNATNWEGEPASYAREGPVLSFFVKPDVSYYGGEAGRGERMVVNDGGVVAAGAYGTSVAAPWIARKLAYLIHIIGLSRELAKALLIDAAWGWKIPLDRKRLGYGLVPKSIREVLGTRNDEIKFVISGATLAYETYTTSLPVPATSKGHPFLARATLVYFPWCDRNQGVDYTNTEMMLKFGPVRPGKTPGTDEIKSLDGDCQGESATAGNSEFDSRKIYRKWDNVKRVANKFTENGRYRKVYNVKNYWGISVITKERGTQRDGIGLPFGIVVTLREINGENRLEEFISGCRYNHWFVARLNPDIRLSNYLSAQTDVTLL